MRPAESGLVIQPVDRAPAGVDSVVATLLAMTGGNSWSIFTKEKAISDGARRGKRIMVTRSLRGRSIARRRRVSRGTLYCGRHFHLNRSRNPRL